MLTFHSTSKMQSPPHHHQYTLFNVTKNDIVKNRKRKKEVITAPKMIEKKITHKGYGKKQNHIINSLLQLSQNTINDYFASNLVNKNNDKEIIIKQFIELNNISDENLSDVINKVEKENGQLSKTDIFKNMEEKKEFYILRFLCNLPATWNMFETDVLEDYLKNIHGNFIINVKPGKRMTFKKKKKSTNDPTNVSFDKEYIEILIRSPSKNDCLPYYIQNGKLHQSKNSNINDKYTVYCIYSLVKYIRNSRCYNYTTVECDDMDSRMIIVNCYVKSTFLELVSDSYYCHCIKYKFGSIINYIPQNKL